MKQVAGGGRSKEQGNTRTRHNGERDLRVVVEAFRSSKAPGLRQPVTVCVCTSIWLETKKYE